MKTKALVQALFAMMLCNCIYSQYFTEISKFGYPYTAFGYSLCISDTVLLIGSPYECYDVNGENRLPGAGAAYIFQQDDSTIFTPIQKLVVSDREPGDYFGNAVSISGNYVIVGAEEEDHDEQGQDSVLYAGSAYIFERDQTGLWKQVQKIVASDRTPYGRFGCSVNISENYAIVGSRSSAYVFKRDNTGKWSQMQIIRQFDGQESGFFVSALSISGEYVIIGAPNTYGNSGAAYIFKRNGSEIWEPVQKLVASDGVSDAFFGSSVSMSMDYAVVGAFMDYRDAVGNSPLPNAGSVYVFKRQTSGEWIQEEKLCASDRSADDIFGNSVGISENKIIVGAIQDSNDSQGGNAIYNAGSAYLFQKENNGKWQEIQKFTSSGRTTHGRFGSSVCISGNRVIIGAMGESQVFIFEETCVPFVIPDPDNIIENGDFGSCTLTSWFTSINSLVGASVNTSLVNGTCLLSDFVISNEPYNWHIQLMQPFTAEQLAKLIPGSDYTLSFEAYSLTKDRQCHVYFGLNGDPWTDLVSQLIEISNGPQTYSFDFYYPSVFSTIKLAFELGSDKTSVIFDNIKLKRKVFDKDNDGIEDLYDNCAEIANTDQADADQDGTGDACESNQTAMDNNTDKNSFRVFPNPAKDKLHIEVANGSVIQLMNMLGTVVQTVPVTDNHFTMDIHQLPGGMYLIKIVKDDFVSLHKIITQ